MHRLPLALLILALFLLALSFVVRPPGGAAVAAPPWATSAPPTPALSPAEQGRALFQAKGCATCHRHDALNIAHVAVTDTVDLDLGDVLGAPALTHYQPNPDFVRRWLRDPAAVRPNTSMPNLRLRDDEIEALLAFLETNLVE